MLRIILIWKFGGLKYGGSSQLFKSPFAHEILFFGMAKMTRYLALLPIFCRVNFAPGCRFKILSPRCLLWSEQSNSSSSETLFQLGIELGFNNVSASFFILCWCLLSMWHVVMTHEDKATWFAAAVKCMCNIKLSPLHLCIISIWDFLLRENDIMICWPIE